MQNIITRQDKDRMIRFIEETDRFTNGERVIEFERAWSRWLEIDHSLFVSSGSTANTLLLSAVKELHGFKNGDKVLVPACTWSTNISPVIQLGFEPIFCDINTYDFSFDTSALEKISKEHQDIKIVFVTHLLGIPADIIRYQEMFPKAVLLEDVCESHGSTINGKKTGTFGEGSTFSFYWGHHMSSVEGGLVCTNNQDLYDIMRSKRSHGFAKELSRDKFEAIKKEYPDIDPSFLFTTDGYNFRNSEIYAVLALSQLEKLDFNNEIRRNNFDYYLSILSKYDCFEVPKKEGNCSFCFPFITKEKSHKDILIDLLKKREIEFRPIVGGNLLRQPFLKGYGDPTCFPNAELLHNNGFYIGNNHFVGQTELSALYRIVEEAYRLFGGKL